MLSTFEVFLLSFVSLLFPVALITLVYSIPPPESFLSKYYRAEKLLNPVGNLFLITVCLDAMTKLAGHFGFIDAATKSTIHPFIGVPFGVLLLAFLGLWVKAFFKVRRLEKSGATT